MREDLKLAWRQLVRAPAFVATATITLALGIGANTAVFSIFNGLLRPLPVADPHQLVVIAASSPGDDTGLRYRFSMGALEDLRAGTSDVLSEVFGFELRLGGLGFNGVTESFIHSAVTANTFEALGVIPARGRHFDPALGDRRRSEVTVVLGHRYWQERFGGSDRLIGATVALDGRAAHVIGVAPAGFQGLLEGADMDGYVMANMGWPHDGDPDRFFTDRSIRPFTVFGRLRPGVTVEQVQANVDAVMTTMSDVHPSTDRGLTARVMPERLARPLPLPFLMQTLPRISWILFGLSTMVLLIASLNVANLLLVRATVREREMAVRSSLGASRNRLLRLLLVESLALSVLGTIAGLALGRALGTALIGSINIGTDVPLRIEATFDWRVFVYGAVSMIVTGLAVGMLPALRASRASVTALLHDASRAGTTSRGRERVRGSLVVAQIAGSLVLLVLAGLAAGSLRQLHRIDLGFVPAGVVTARLNTQHLGYSSQRSVVFYDELERRLKGLPGVEFASLSATTPLSYIYVAYVARPEGEAAIRDISRPSLGANIVTPGYFSTMRIPLITGRVFTDRDTEASARVAIVNDTLAARFWPQADPIGKGLVIPEIDDEPWQVVGVTATGKYLVPFETPLPHFYLAQAQNPTNHRALQIRSAAPVGDLRRQVRDLVESLAPGLPVADFKRLEDVVSGSLGFALFGVAATQAGLLGGLGMLLAVVGVYGLVSFKTAQRSREIGIRMSLGAVPADVRRLILRQGAKLAVAGVATGMVAALLLSLAIQRVVLVSPADPLTFAAASAVLVLSALAACYLPARRAMRIEPAEALRRE